MLAPSCPCRIVHPTLLLTLAGLVIWYVLVAWCADVILGPPGRAHGMPWPARLGMLLLAPLDMLHAAGAVALMLASDYARAARLQLARRFRGWL
jgi:hypothetical protein